MFCPNCGNKLNENASFCSECGTNIDKSILNNISNSEYEQNYNNKTLSKQLEDKFLTPILTKTKMLFKKIKNFILNHKKILGVIILIVIIISLSIILFNKFYDFTTIEWDKENGDFSVTHTQSTTLELFVLAYDKEKNQIIDIDFSVDGGTIEIDKNKVTWSLPKESGSYNIIAKSSSGKKIEKNVNVINIEKDEPLNGLYQETIDDDVADNDNDGLTNNEEKKLGTDPNLADTDQDGLTDYYEINVSKTDPLNKDTDGDGINDGDELDLGLNPLKIDSKGDGINDGDRKLTYSLNDSKLGVTIQIIGKGNIASTTIDKIKNSTFKNMNGMLDIIYNFYTTGDIESAAVTIKYDINDIKSKGLNEDNLTLYYFDEDTKKLEKIPTEINKTEKTLKVTLKHFSKYVIGDSNKVSTITNNQIMMVIDNSVSMYTYDQLSKLGYTQITGADGNDSTFKRLLLTNKLIDMFTGSYYFGISEFAGNYINLQKFTNNQESTKKAVNSIKNDLNNIGAGTNIVNALNRGINEFKKDDNGHYLILLTDGKDTSIYNTLSSNKTTIIANAKSKNVKICVIGLGTNIDTEDLNLIAEKTGCDYYNASDVSALDEIYSLVGASINYNYVDTNKDNKTDGMIIENTGFLVNRDGFSFANFASNKSTGGHCYGMALFAMLYYKNELPKSLPDKQTQLNSLIHKQILFAKGYDLENTYFEKHKNLYDFKISTDGLKIALNIPDDYRDRIENDTWMIKTDYLNKLKEIGTTISIKDYKENDEEFTKYQSALLNIDTDEFKQAVSNDEYQFLSAIWRLFILQLNKSTTSFTTDPDKAYEELILNLSNDIPQVIGINGNHAINVIGIVQDNKDANKFKLAVYDNNYPGETRYITMKRSKIKYRFGNISTALTNENEYAFYYDSDNDGQDEKTTISLSTVKVS